MHRRTFLALAGAAPALLRATPLNAREARWRNFEVRVQVELLDVAREPASGGPLPFFMYPQAEVGTTRRDSLAPESFRYAITASEVKAED